MLLRRGGNDAALNKTVEDRAACSSGGTPDSKPHSKWVQAPPAAARVGQESRLLLRAPTRSG